MFNSILLSKLNPLPTPFYYYDLQILNETLTVLKKISDSYDFKIHYALKANSSERILKMISKFGFGADCVSGNEVKRALENGFSPDEIVFAGVGKTDDEISFALSNNIHSFNCESLQEIEVINEIAKEIKIIAPIALRINPDIDAKSHHFITTGLEENKFGIPYYEMLTALELLEKLDHVELIGMHVHIGSQITDMDVFKSLCVRVNEIQHKIKERHIDVHHINVGGGLGVDYHHPDEKKIPNFKNYFAVFDQFLERFSEQTIHFELGRALVAQCGSLISRVLYIKNGVNTKFAILDAGMTELIRPALYQSYHKIENLTSNGAEDKYDVVGPICESSDCFGKAVQLPQTSRGDMIAIRSTGAYGEVMISNYNLRDKVKSYYSSDFK
jgi:diaminopimelate decarboxylase